MQISTNTFFRQNTDALQELKTQTAQLQETISTGTKISVPSDDPVAFSNLALLKARDARLTQYGRNINSATQTLNLQENTLTQATNILTRLHELSIEGSNGTLSSSDRKLMAVEVKGLSANLVSLANTQDSNGQPIFGGFQSGEPFQQNPDGTVTYKGDSNQSQTTVADHETVTVGLSGNEVFDRVPLPGGPSKSVFQIVKAMGDALANGDSPVTQGDEISAALNQVTGELAVVGSRTATLNNAKDNLTSTQTENTAQMSLLEDTDVTKAVSDLTQKMTTMDAAQASFVKIAGMSLWNYLK